MVKKKIYTQNILRNSTLVSRVNFQNDFIPTSLPLLLSIIFSVFSRLPFCNGDKAEVAV